MRRTRRIAVMGVGVVGGAVKRWLERQGHTVAAWDPYKGLRDRAGLEAAEIVFVCVPTPYTQRGYDGSAVDEAVNAIPGEKVVVIKSTVLPGTTDRLQQRLPRHRFLFNPEFLRERTAEEDFAAPDRQIVGFTERSRAHAETIMSLLPSAPYARIMPAREAELAKYMTNTFLALKVTFANQFFDLCERLGANYEIVKEAAAADPRIGPSHLDVADGGYRGYAGMCLPKDMKALIDFAAEVGVPLRLLKTADILNDQLRANASAPEHVRAVAPLGREALVARAA